MAGHIREISAIFGRYLPPVAVQGVCHYKLESTESESY
jgi:hypothetical protein